MLSTRCSRPLFRGIPNRRRAGALLVFAFALFTTSSACADPLTFTIEIRGHLFYPAEFQVPAGTKVKLIVINQDPTPEEFESYELNREKVIMGGAKAMIFIGGVCEVLSG